MLDNPIKGAAYHLDSSMIIPSSSTNKKITTEEKNKTTRNDKSLPMSKLEELNQVFSEQNSSVKLIQIANKLVKNEKKT